jgi:hypothetical protein
MARMTFSKTTVESSALLGYKSKFSNDHLQMFNSQSSLSIYAQVASHLGATDHLAHLAGFRSVKANPKFLSPSFFTIHLKLNTRACTVRTPFLIDRVCSITRRRRHKPFLAERCSYMIAHVERCLSSFLLKPKAHRPRKRQSQSRLARNALPPFRF